MSKVIAYVDGASRGNPGNAGIGIVFINEQNNVVKEISDYIGQTTNNIAEYTAMVTALKEALEMNFEEIEVISDSELMVKQINGEYQVKVKVSSFYKEACELLKSLKNTLLDMSSESITKKLTS